MEYTIKGFESKELNEVEKGESLKYVCYERSLYHYFKRNNDISNFDWLFCDRIFGFSYADGNEPIVPVRNGLNKLVKSIQVTMITNKDELLPLMLERFSGGYLAHAMLSITRPDGSTYTTSTLFEGIIGDTVYYTKTSETSFNTCLEMNISELKSRFPVDEEGRITINFIKAPKELIINLRRTNLSLYHYIMKDLYGFSYQQLIDESKSMLDYNGLDKLLSHFRINKKTIICESVSKKNQLRMHKHIANKIEPMLVGWNSIVKNEECGEIIGLWLKEEILKSSNLIKGKLKDLLKWSSMVFSRPQDRFMDSYINELSNLIDEFKRYQNLVFEANIKLMEIDNCLK